MSTLDKERGAGLELEPCAHGYLVQSVDIIPGQALKPGDVIITIDGVPLWGSLEEDDLNAAFGSRFGQGGFAPTSSRRRVSQNKFYQCETD